MLELALHAHDTARKQLQCQLHEQYLSSEYIFLDIRFYTNY